MGDTVNDNLIKGWIEAQAVDVESDQYDDVSWAIDDLYDLVYDDPEELLKTVQLILGQNSSEKVIGALGAGVIEELIVNSDELVIEKLLDIVSSNDNLKRCFKYVYVDQKDVTPKIYDLIQKQRK